MAVVAADAGHCREVLDACERFVAGRPEVDLLSAHLDLACSDIDAVVAWHRELGAQRVGGGRAWAVMRDPASGVYCLTSRDPRTGRATE